MTGKFDGKKGPGRRRTSYLTRLKKWLDPTANENVIIQASVSRETWRNMIANALTGLGKATNADDAKKLGKWVLCTCPAVGTAYQNTLKSDINHTLFLLKEIDQRNFVFSGPHLFLAWFLMRNASMIVDIDRCSMNFYMLMMILKCNGFLVTEHLLMKV